MWLLHTEMLTLITNHWVEIAFASIFLTGMYFNEIDHPRPGYSVEENEQ